MSTLFFSLGVAALLVIASVAAQPLVLEQHTALMTVFDGIGATTMAIKPKKHIFFSFFLSSGCGQDGMCPPRFAANESCSISSMFTCVNGTVISMYFGGNGNGTISNAIGLLTSLQSLCVVIPDQQRASTDL